MSKKSVACLHVLLNRFHSGPKEQLFDKLHPIEKELVKQQATHSEDLIPLIEGTSPLFQQVHRTWLEPILEKLPAGIDSLLLSALPDNVSLALVKDLKIKVKKVNLTPEVGAFIREIFAPYFVSGEDVLPIAYLPELPLSPLLKLSKNQLCCIMDFLGIYDLAPVARHIIEKEKLQAYEKCLTPKEKEFLHQCLHKKEKITAHPLDIKDWNGDCAKLRKALHKRGLVRMAHALCGYPDDFIWHFVRKLDVGRGTFVLKTLKKPSDPEVLRELGGQIRLILKVLNFTENRAKVKGVTDV